MIMFLLIINDACAGTHMTMHHTPDAVISHLSECGHDEELPTIGELASLEEPMGYVYPDAMGGWSVFNFSYEMKIVSDRLSWRSAGLYKSANDPSDEISDEQRSGFNLQASQFCRASALALNAADILNDVSEFCDK